jgi:RNA polymerase sigma factor, sigma-70 family
VLAVRAQDGDRAALAALVERHEPRVRRLAGYLLDDPQDAEDAAQEALAKVLTRIDQFRGEARFATWLYSLVPTPAVTSASASAAGSTSRWRPRPRRRRPRGPTISPASVSSAPSGRGSWRACPTTSGT